MPIDNSLAEQIGANQQQQDPFRRVLEFSKIGSIAARNRLYDAQTGEAGARAGEAAASMARIKLLTQQQPADHNKANSLPSRVALTTATTNLARSLRPLDIKLHIGGDIQGDTGATTASYAPTEAVQ
jgi:hypothetical protein